MTGPFRRADERTLLDIFQAAVSTYPDTVYLDFEAGQVTYAEFGDRVLRMASAFDQIGIRGRTVASILDNSPESLIVWFAVNIARGIHAPINVALKGPWLYKQLASLNPAIIVADARYAERCADYLVAAPASVTLVTRTGDRLAGVPAGTSVRVLAELESCPPVEAVPPLAPHEVTAITFTSGTTAASKGCVLPHGYVVNMAEQIIVFTERQREEVCFTCLPFFHLNAMSSAIATMILGGTLGVSLRFSASHFWDEVERTGAAVIQLLGSMPYLVANSPDTEAGKRCYGQVRAAVGAPITPEVKERLRQRFGIKHIASSVYGSTEASCLTYTRCSENVPPGSSGRVSPEFDVRIFDEHDREVPAGEVGEIVFRPLRPNVMCQGYWQAPEETIRRLSGLWWHTRDLGRLDERGYLYFLEREKDSVRRRGETIATQEVEDIFSAHPGVLEAVAYGIPSELGDDELMLAVVRKSGTVLKEEALLLWAVDRLPYFALPQFIEFRDDLPRNELGRVLKRDLRAEGVTARAWNRNSANIDLDRT